MKNVSYFTGERQHQYTDDHLNPFFSDWLDGITQNENKRDALKPGIQQNQMSTTLELTQAIENISSVLSSSLIDSSQSIPIDQVKKHKNRITASILLSFLLDYFHFFF